MSNSKAQQQALKDFLSWSDSVIQTANAPKGAQQAQAAPAQPAGFGANAQQAQQAGQAQAALNVGAQAAKITPSGKVVPGGKSPQPQAPPKTGPGSASYKIAKAQGDQINAQTKQLAASAQLAAGALSDKGQEIQAQVASLPTPGGIGAMLLILFFFIWVVVPVNSGYTRVQLLWLMLQDKVYLQRGSSGDFGSPSKKAAPTVFDLSYTVGGQPSNGVSVQPDFSLQ